MKRILTLVFSFLFLCTPNHTFAQSNELIIAQVGFDFSTEIILDSQPGLISDLPYWIVGEHPEWTNVSITTQMEGNPNSFDAVINYFLVISGSPNPNNLGENIITSNLINPWTGEVVEVMTTIINVVETAPCACPAVYAPVCASDEVTYSNSCEAACIGVDILYDGNCEVSGCTADDGTFYANGENWNVDDCSFCSCEGGQIFCAVIDCAWPNCEDPIYIDGECCPVCPENIEGCMDENAQNFNPQANIDDGSCEYDCPNICCMAMTASCLACSACMSLDEYCTLFPNTPGCETYGCTNPSASNFNQIANIDDGSCIWEDCIGEISTTDLTIFIEDNICHSDSYNLYCSQYDWDGGDCIFDCNENLMSVIEVDEFFYNDQCDDFFNCNYFDFDNGSCLDAQGCTDDDGITYDHGVQWSIDPCTLCSCENGEIFCLAQSCEEPQCNNPIFIQGECCPICPENTEGCMDENAQNFNPQANIDDGSCEYDCPNTCCMAMTASCLACSACMSLEEYCTLFPNTPGCEIYGCTDTIALNYNQIATVEDGSCEYSNGPNWDYVITGSNHTLILGNNMFTDLYGESLDVGDWIGVFFEVNGELICGGSTIWEDTTTVIPAQGDDLTTDVKDGFASGEDFQWLIWDTSENMTIHVNAEYASQEEESFTPDGITPISSLIAVPLISEQEVELNLGWNMFSSYMNNNGMSIQDVFSPYVNLITIIKNYMGQAYLPEWNYDGIGTMINGQGYQAKMLSSASIHFQGEYLNPEENPISLKNGWNIIGYLRTNPATTAEVFSNIEDLVVVKNNEGMAYLPEFEFDGIGMMEHGQGFQVKVLSDQILQYLSNDVEYRINHTSVKTKLHHFSKPLNTGANMSIVLPKQAWLKSPKPGDEIGVYNNKGLLVGAMPYQKGVIVIPIYGNDNHSTEIDGLMKGETFSLALWSNTHKYSSPLKIKWKEEPVVYQTNEIIYASEIDFNFEKNNLNQVTLFPNPTDLNTELHASLREESEIEISIFDLLGKRMFYSINKYKKGALKQVLNIEHLLPGSYIIELKTKDELLHKNLIVK